jgi:hypothetical protein
MKVYFGPWAGCDLRLEAFTPAEITDWELFVRDQLAATPQTTRIDEIEAFMRANPGTDSEDYWDYELERYVTCDGRVVFCPLSPPDETEVPWDRLDRAMVRRLATSSLARRLPHNVRQAAGRDAGLMFNHLSRRHRLRPHDLSPPEIRWLDDWLRASASRGAPRPLPSWITQQAMGGDDG